MLERRERLKAKHGNNGFGLTIGQWAALLPTPAARDHFPPHSQEYIAEKKAQGHGMSNLNDWAALLPTPNAGDWKAGTSDLPHGKQSSLPRTVGREAAMGSLNPDFVSVMMGFPADWTEI